MKVAFSSNENNGLDSTIAHHFGRCPFYVFVEIDGKEVKNVQGEEIRIIAITRRVQFRNILRKKTPKSWYRVEWAPAQSLCSRNCTYLRLWESQVR